MERIISTSPAWNLESYNQANEYKKVGDILIECVNIKVKSKLAKSNELFKSKETSHWLYNLGKDAVKLTNPMDKVAFVHVSIINEETNEVGSLCCFEYENFEQFNYIFKRYVEPISYGLYQLKFYHGLIPPAWRVMIWKGGPTWKAVDGEAKQTEKEVEKDQGRVLVPDGFNIVVFNGQMSHPLNDAVYAGNVHIYRKLGEYWSRYIMPRYSEDREDGKGWTKNKFKNARFFPYTKPAKSSKK